MGYVWNHLQVTSNGSVKTESGIPHTSESCECGNLLAMEKFKFQASHEILCNWLKKCNNLRIAKQKKLKMGWVLNAGIEFIQFLTVYKWDVGLLKKTHLQSNWGGARATEWLNCFKTWKSSLVFYGYFGSRWSGVKRRPALFSITIAMTLTAATRELASNQALRGQI